MSRVVNRSNGVQMDQSRFLVFGYSEMPLSQKPESSCHLSAEATTADSVCWSFISSDHFKIIRDPMATLLPLICTLRPSQHILKHTRCISTTTACYSRAVKKRINRLKSDHYAYPEDVSIGKQGPNDNPPLTLVNRNPRNLEQLHREIKPLGWELETPTRVYWNTWVTNLIS